MRHGIRELREHPAGRRDRVLRGRGSRPRVVTPLPQHRRKPGPTWPPMSLLIDGSRLAPGMRFWVAVADAETTRARLCIGAFLRSAPGIAAAVAGRRSAAPRAGPATGTGRGARPGPA